MKNIINPLILLLMIVSSVSAHPGHGTYDGFLPLHFLTSPIHLALILTLAVAFIYAIYLRSVKQKK